MAPVTVFLGRHGLRRILRAAPGVPGRDVPTAPPSRPSAGSADRSLAGSPARPDRRRRRAKNVAGTHLPLPTGMELASPPAAGRLCGQSAVRRGTVRQQTGKVIEFAPHRRRRAAPKPRLTTGARRRRVWKLVFLRRRVEFSLVLVVAIALAGFVGTNTHLTASEAVSGHVTHVRDGDTIEVGGRPIRLQGLNCAERGTRLGEAATAAIRRLVSGQPLTCELNGERTYDREVGRCYLPSGYDVAAVLISLGYADAARGMIPSGSTSGSKRKPARTRATCPATAVRHGDREANCSSGSRARTLST